MIDAFFMRMTNHFMESNTLGLDGQSPYLRWWMRADCDRGVRRSIILYSFFIYEFTLQGSIKVLVEIMSTQRSCVILSVAPLSFLVLC